MLFKKYVAPPTDRKSIEEHHFAYKIAGLPGCLGSTDATHVVLERCPYKLRQLHMGYKIALTCRTYNLTCDHRRRILSTTSGHPARFNNKTLIMFDQFMLDLKAGKFDKEFNFKLYDTDRNGNVVKNMMDAMSLWIMDTWIGVQLFLH